jgi:hypothetical protein
LYSAEEINEAAIYSGPIGSVRVVASKFLKLCGVHFADGRRSSDAGAASHFA